MHTVPNRNEKRGNLEVYALKRAKTNTKHTNKHTGMKRNIIEVQLV